MTAAWAPALQFLAKTSPAPFVVTGFDLTECALDVKQCQRVALNYGGGGYSGFRVLLEPYTNPFASPLWLAEPGWGQAWAKQTVLAGKMRLSRCWRGRGVRSGRGTSRRK